MVYSQLQRMCGVFVFLLKEQTKHFCRFLLLEILDLYFLLPGSFWRYP